MTNEDVWMKIDSREEVKFSDLLAAQRELIRKQWHLNSNPYLYTVEDAENIRQMLDKTNYLIEIAI